MSDYYTLIPNFKDEINAFLNQSKNIAFIGINKDPKSLSYKIFENLKNDLNVLPISEEIEILNKKCYANLSEIKCKLDAAIIVTTTQKTLKACQECFENKILNVWIEIGSESKEALDYCKDKNMNVVYLHSILKERINPSSKYKSKKES